MNTVTLSIGPKTYTVACAEGQEAHIRALGAMIAEKYAQLGQTRAPLEAQNLLFAALFLADELAEARKRLATEPEPMAVPAPEADTGEIEALREALAQMEDELATARAAAARPVPVTPQFDLFGGQAPGSAAEADLATRLEELAERIEANATALEAAAASA
ncbi:MAG: cell division protein ZapA [Sphingomonadales bacterium]|nr:MAG: cell division protein ZapA [Sphingomonadales bacterium]